MTTPVVAVLGTGVMGAGMVRSLRRADIPVRMWNRNQDRLRALTDTGAQACGTPAEAAAGADVVLTMVFDADAAIEVARELGLVLVDCPVLGTKAPAENGALVMLASGPDEARDRLEPVFQACGSKTLWLGEAGQGSRLKLACNAWVLMYTAGIAQSVALTRVRRSARPGSPTGWTPPSWRRCSWRFRGSSEAQCCGPRSRYAWTACRSSVTLWCRATLRSRGSFCWS
jgi:3-hydroxyisobutyrate dehydrogenase